MWLTRRKTLKAAAGALTTGVIAGCTSDDAEAELDDGDASESSPESEDESDSDSSSTSESEEDSVNEDNNEGDETDEEDLGDGRLELLAEENIDHDHACLHAEFDERTSLEAGGSVEESPTENRTHIIWEVTYEDDVGYVSFDASAYARVGSIVFYTAGGSAQPVTGTEIDQDTVGDDDCEYLDEYIQVEPDDGEIVLELMSSS